MNNYVNEIKNKNQKGYVNANSCGLNGSSSTATCAEQILQPFY